MELQGELIQAIIDPARPDPDDIDYERRLLYLTPL